MMSLGQNNFRTSFLELPPVDFKKLLVIIIRYNLLSQTNIVFYFIHTHTMRQIGVRYYPFSTDKETKVQRN